MKNIILLASFKLLFLFLIAYMAGLLVRYKHVRVNYTRKINHFCIFFVPALLDHYFLKDATGYSTALINQAIFIFASSIVFIRAIRTKVPTLAIAFSSFDRPEDRPYTLLWYSSQLVVGYVVLFPAILIFDHFHMITLLNILIAITVFGDGLAEPIGIRFGKHKYTTSCLFSKRKYVRSIEGSLAVFIVSLIVLFIFHHAFDHAQFLMALVFIPIAMTLAEAVSPHTWDDPFMITAGSFLIFLIKRFF